MAKKSQAATKGRGLIGEALKPSPGAHQQQALRAEAVVSVDQFDGVDSSVGFNTDQLDGDIGASVGVGVDKHVGVAAVIVDNHDCYQDAMAERINGILKMEFLLHRPKNLAAAVKMVGETVLVYNTKRPHPALKYKTPDAVPQAF